MVDGHQHNLRIYHEMAVASDVAQKTENKFQTSYTTMADYYVKCEGSGLVVSH